MSRVRKRPKGPKLPLNPRTKQPLFRITGPPIHDDHRGDAHVLIKSLDDINLGKGDDLSHLGEELSKSLTIIDFSKWGSLHYKKNVETIDFLRANLHPGEFIGFLRGNIIKYVTRHADDLPGPKELADAKKALHYAFWLYRELGGTD